MSHEVLQHNIEANRLRTNLVRNVPLSVRVEVGFDYVVAAELAPEKSEDHATDGAPGSSAQKGDGVDETLRKKTGDEDEIKATKNGLPLSKSAATSALPSETQDISEASELMAGMAVRDGVEEESSR